MIDRGDSDLWTAYGVTASTIIYAILACIAIWQIRESRRVRETQLRPIVIVEPNFQGTLVHFSVRNVGTTPAYNVSITRSQTIQPIEAFGDRWMDTALFSTSGMPMLGPGRMIRFILGRYLALEEASPAMRMSGTVTYRSLDGKEYAERYDCDLAIYRHARTDKDPLASIADSAKNLGKDVQKLTQAAKRIENCLTSDSRAIGPQRSSRVETDPKPDEAYGGSES